MTKQAANVPKVEESGFADFSAKPKTRAEQNKTRAAKPVTQVANVPKVKADRFTGKPAKRSNDGTVGKGNKMASKPVTQATIAKAVGVHRGVATGR